jgi:hypothetical protein
MDQYKVILFSLSEQTKLIEENVDEDLIEKM